MVIFGAGASFDSFERLRFPNVNEYRLPLANQLFDSRFGDYYQLFPKCQPLIQRLQRPGINVEHVLENFQSDAIRYSPRLIQLASVRYYLNFMLARCQADWTSAVTKGVTNYQTMLDQIAEQIPGETVCLVTFNYDTLLEHAIVDIGIRLSTIADYTTSEFKVVKLHGSINWAHPIRDFKAQRTTSQELIGDIIERARRIDIDDTSYEMVSDNPFERPPRPFFPALAIPVQTKQRYECPQEQKLALAQCLPQVTKVLVIGWQANENLFLDTMAQGLVKKARIMVVSGTEKGAKEVIARIMAGLGTTKIAHDFEAAKPGFSEFIFSSEWEDFLRAKS